MTPEIHMSSDALPDGNAQVTLAVQTLAGLYEKRFILLASTLEDSAAIERAHAFFKQQIMTDIRRLRDQLNGWSL